jgi:hypothetical protein
MSDVMSGGVQKIGVRKTDYVQGRDSKRDREHSSDDCA